MRWMGDGSSVSEAVAAGSEPTWSRIGSPGQNGELPCLRGARVSRLSASICNAAAISADHTNGKAYNVALGGTTTRVKTYGQLVSGIINPSHELARAYAKEVVSQDGESKMYNYNQHMTVQELVDIVMYLQPKYDVIVPQYRYRIYPTT